MRSLAGGKSEVGAGARVVQIALCAVLVAGPVVVRLAGGGWPPVLVLGFVGALLLAVMGGRAAPEIALAFVATVALAEWVSAIGPAVDGSDSFTHGQLTGGLVPLALLAAAAVGSRRRPTP